MAIELTPQQLQALDADPCRQARVVDPRSNTSYVLVNEADYETIRELFEDEPRQRSIRTVGLHNAVGRMEEMR